MIKNDEVFMIPLALLSPFINVCINMFSIDAVFWDTKCFVKSHGFKKNFKMIKFSLSFSYTYKEYVTGLYYIIA